MPLGVLEMAKTGLRNAHGPAVVLVPNAVSPLVLPRPLPFLKIAQHGVQKMVKIGQQNVRG